MGIFNSYIKPGKGVQKKDLSENFGIKRFFETFGDKFWKLVVLNLLFFLVNCPVFALFARLAGVGGVPYQAPVNVLFQPLAGVMLHGENPALSALYGVLGIQVEHGYPTTVSHILTIVGLLSIFTFGISSAAMSYVQRNFVRRQPTDVAEDFFLSIKRNFKDALVLGLFDLVALFIIAFDVSYGLFIHFVSFDAPVFVFDVCYFRFENCQNAQKCLYSCCVGYLAQFALRLFGAFGACFECGAVWYGAFTRSGNALYFHHFHCLVFPNLRRLARNQKAHDRSFLRGSKRNKFRIGIGSSIRRSRLKKENEFFVLFFLDKICIFSAKQ